MLNEEQLRAILSLKLANASSSDFDKKVAEGDCWQLGLLDGQNNLKPEFAGAVNTLMRYVESGLPITTAIEKTKNEFQEPPKSYADMLSNLGV